MTVMEILGQDHTGDSLWVRFDGDEFDVTPSDLAVARRTEQRAYKQATLHGRPVDDTQIRTLINAMNAPQPYWPPLVCRVPGCGIEAQTKHEGEPYCGAHGRYLEEDS